MTGASIVRQDLRLARLRLGLSQRALAIEAGVARETVRNLEAGARDTTPAVAKKVADVLHLTVLEVLGIPDQEEAA